MLIGTLSMFTINRQYGSTNAVLACHISIWQMREYIINVFALYLNLINWKINM